MMAHCGAMYFVSCIWPRASRRSFLSHARTHRRRFNMTTTNYINHFALLRSARAFPYCNPVIASMLMLLADINASHERITIKRPSYAHMEGGARCGQPTIN